MKPTSPLFSPLRSLGAATLGVLLTLGTAGTAWAHKASDAYLSLEPTGEQTVATYAIALRDLDLVVAVDANNDAAITQGELRAATPDTLAYVQAHVRWQLPAGCASTPVWTWAGTESHTDGAYARVQTTLACAPIGVDYRVLQDVDAQHRVMVRGSLNGQAVLNTLAPGQTLSWAAANDATPASASGMATLWAYLLAGMHHLWEGWDHMAFLLALLLPVQLSKASGVRELFKTITAFTLGHSLTLALSQTGHLSLPSYWVELTIALSIGVSALWVLRPLPGLNPWRMAGAFGLMHGLGFSGQLSEMQAPESLLMWALAGFNLGVEVAQLLLVAVWALITWPVAHKPAYRRFAVPGMASGLVAASGYFAWGVAMG